MHDKEYWGEYRGLERIQSTGENTEYWGEYRVLGRIQSNCERIKRTEEEYRELRRIQRTG